MFYSHPKSYRLPLACLLGLLLLGRVCNAQEVLPVAPDSVQSDTVRQRFDARVIENLKKLSERKTVMGKLLKSVLVFDRVDEEVYGLDAELIQREYEKHTYKIVRRIDIMSLDAFGYSVHDTARVPRNIFEKLGNSLHVKTGRGLIRNKLLFEKMAPLEPLALVESERLLRQTRYLLDARIIVNEETTTADSVDVFVITKDIFSLGGSGSYTPSSQRGRIRLRELNFLGQGHQVEGSYRFDPGAPRPWEIAGFYTIENIGRTYITADAAYVDKNFYKEKSVYLRRDFFATNTKYAGAVGASWISERIMLPPTAEDTAQRYSNLTYNQQDAWLGRSFRFKSYNLGYEPRGRVITGIRFINTNYSVKATENFQDNTLVMASLGYSVRKYYKDRYLFGFGRTEDIPAGTLLSFTAGYENGELRQRSYVGAGFSLAKYAPSFGYLYGRASYDSFIRKGQWEQGVLQFESLYFTKLAEWGNNWKLRHFMWGRGTWGINRFPEELLSINKESGIRGFRSSLLRGSRRVALNYEANLYTPFSLFGFKLATVFFADVAWLSSGNKSNPFSYTPYQGYGIGFRFRNEFLSFSTIQFLIGYYPKLPPNEDINSIKTIHSSRPYYDFRDFQFTRPGVAEFY